MDTKDWFMAFFAVYGAALSTFNLIAAKRRDSRSIKVSVVRRDADPMLEVGAAGYFIKVVNHGFRPTTVTQPVLELPGGKKYRANNPTSTTSFPHELKDGAACVVAYSEDEMLGVLKKHGFTGWLRIVPACEDMLGVVHRGRAIRIDIAKWRERNDSRNESASS